MKGRFEQSAKGINIMFSVETVSFAIVWMWCNIKFLSGTFSSQIEVKAIVEKKKWHMPVTISKTISQQPVSWGLEQPKMSPNAGVHCLCACVCMQRCVRAPVYMHTCVCRASGSGIRHRLSYAPVKKKKKTCFLNRIFRWPFRISVLLKDLFQHYVDFDYIH